MKKILICGGRDYEDYGRLEDELNLLWRAEGEYTIIHGCARGADSLAGQYAKQYNNPVEEYPADWDKYGRRAGPLRNIQMLEEGKPDLVVAFPGGRGTAHMIKIAQDAGVEVIKIDE